MNKITAVLLLFASLLYGANECITCHKGIEDIRDRDSGMMKAILKIADKAGHKGNDCIVCHGGNPKAKKKKQAHSGTVEYFEFEKGPKEFYPAPGSTWINENTCGVCHPTQVGSQMNSLMMTDQGKIQGALWSFGAKEGYEHTAGTYKTKNPTNPDDRLGTDVYKKYMQKLATMEPQAFPKEMHELPNAPTADEVHKDPSLAVYTYLNQESLRNNTRSKSHSRRGDYGGAGCASCHIPYSNEGYYEGKDKKISKEPGHLLTHKIQSSRKVKVQVNDVNYSGIPVETCSTCHNRGKRIGVSYQGLMETEYQSALKSEGNKQPKLPAKKYLHMQEDIHYQKGMLCQDCHTSNDLHGDGFLGGANAAVVEIECQDCHGTTKKYPWELPIGYSDEFNTTEASGEARGVTQDLAEYLQQGYVPEKEDGYILTARGNPLPKAVKKGNKIIIHLASGKDIELKPLKLLKNTEALSAEGVLSMDTIDAHTAEMECYTCHATWAPQIYGKHVKVDYSAGKKKSVDGEVTKTRAYLRWEDPALCQNGEGRVSPTIPGEKADITVIGKNAKILLEKHNSKNSNTIDMAPVQPHTIQKKARTCESCHSSNKALGLGIGGVKYDFSKFIDENATQHITLGHRFKLSAPLNKEQIDKLDRRGVCFSCHKNIPNGNLAEIGRAHV